MDVFLGSEVITIVRAPLVVNARDNSQYRDWATATRVDVPGCSVQPFPTTKNRLFIEDEINREFGANYFRVWAPSGTSVLYTDRMEWRSLSFEMTGVPGPWFDFEGLESHVAFLVYIREG